MKNIFFSLVMALSIVSCSTDELSNGGGNGSQKGIQLVLSTDGFDVAGSRTVDEYVIRDVNILEYVNGGINQVAYLSESNTDFSQNVKVYGLENLPATTMEDATDAEGNKVQVMKESGLENFIFVVANYGSKINSEDVSSLEKLKTFTMSFSGKKTMANLPMTGFYYGGINGTSTTTMNVTLQRAVAKIDFTLNTSNFKIGGKTPEQFSVNSIKLCNVPENITLYPCKVRPSLPKSDTEAGKWNFGSQTPFPTTSEMASSVTYGDDQNQSSTANTYVAYIPENARGSYSNITDNEDKHPSKCDSKITDEKGDKTYTYILVDLLYVMSNGTAGNATYRIYLGGNKTGDMNLLRNTEYTVTTSLKDANTADTRISVNDVSDTYLAAANCYMIDMSGGAKNVIIPLSQVNKGWTKIAEYDTSQSGTATQVANMLESGDWNIQTEWRTWSGSSNITGTKVANFSANNLRATLTIPADVKNGENAVVKLVSTKDNKTYWSWHLWFTDYKPNELTDAKRHGQVHQYSSAAFQTGGTYEGKFMMDRNLGATITGLSGAIGQPPATTEEAIKYYGLYYQWGRKDPFVGSSNGKYNGKKVSLYDAQGSPYTQGILNGAETLVFSVQNLGTFFTNYGDWLSSPNDDLWSGKTAGTAKSVFDPCPPGWRVPKSGTTATNNPWLGFPTSNLVLSGSNYATLGYLYNDNGVQAWYPACGSLYFSTGSVFCVGQNGYYWSATPNGDKGLPFYLYFYRGSISPFCTGDGCTTAFPVRCIQE